MKILRHKGRHIVVADLPETTTELPDNIKVIGRIGLDPSIAGTARRGRPPSYDQPVDSKYLEIVDHSTVDQQTLDQAKSMVAIATQTITDIN